MPVLPGIYGENKIYLSYRINTGRCDIINLPKPAYYGISKRKRGNMNKVFFCGRLVRNPEVRYSKGEKESAIARFSIAVDRKTKKDGEPAADFFNCITFGKKVEFVEKYLRHGTKVIVSGRVQNDNYTNKDGVKVYSVQIMVDEIEFAESKNAVANSDNKTKGGFTVVE